MRDDPAHLFERVRVVVREVVRDAGEARVDVAAPELLGRHVLARGRLHEGRAREEDRPLVLHDDGLVRHRGDVRAARRARAEDGRDLREARGAHARLVVEDAPEVVAVGEDLGLQREERAARVHEVDRREAVLERDLLRAEVLLDRDRVVGPALHGRVVRDDHDGAALDPADARHEAGPRCGAVVETVPCERRDLEEGRVGVEESLEALAHRKLPARDVALPLFLASALARLREFLPEAGREGPVVRGILLELAGRRREFRDEDLAHAGPLSGRPRPVRRRGGGSPRRSRPCSCPEGRRRAPPSP